MILRTCATVAAVPVPEHSRKSPGLVGRYKIVDFYWPLLNNHVHVAQQRDHGVASNAGENSAAELRRNHLLSDNKKTFITPHSSM